MANHLTDEQLAGFQQGTLPIELLLDADDHLSSCDACRVRLSSKAKPLRINAPVELIHATYEQLAACAGGGKLDPEAAAHIRECVACRGDVEDLKRVRGAKGRWRFYSIVAGIAAAVAIGTLVYSPTIDVPQPQPAAPKQLAHSVRDGAATIGVNDEGRLDGNPAIAPDDQRLLASALQSGIIPLAKLPDDLKSNRSVLLGPESKSEEFRVQNPVGELVLADRPEFRWQPVPSAGGYRLDVYNLNFEKVASSGKIAATAWTPEKPLPRGQVLIWQVTAFTKKGEVRSPQPPAPEARFQVIDNKSLKAIDEARPVSHLLVALRLAQAGLRVDALHELDELAAMNPNSTVIANLRRSLEPGAKH